MIEALLVRLFGAAAFAIIKAIWKPVAIGLGAIVLAASIYGVYHHIQNKIAEGAQAKLDRDAAVHTSRTNADVIGKMARDEKAARDESNRQAAADLKTTADHAAIVKDLENAPTGSDPAGLYFDDLSDRLRNLDQAPGPH